MVPFCWKELYFRPIVLKMLGSGRRWWNIHFAFFLIITCCNSGRKLFWYVIWKKNHCHKEKHEARNSWNFVVYIRPITTFFLTLNDTWDSINYSVTRVSENGSNWKKGYRSPKLLWPLHGHFMGSKNNEHSHKQSFSTCLPGYSSFRPSSQISLSEGSNPK